jgi:hypothetical protein
MAKQKRQKRTKLKVVSLEDVYRLINRVQTVYKEAHFYLKFEDAVIARNVLKDAGLEFEERELQKKIAFLILPPPEREEELDIDIDFLEDEIPEENEVF